jgi:hypothetical protein
MNAAPKANQNLAERDPMRCWLAFSPQRAQRTQRSGRKKESGPRKTQPFPFRSGSVTSVASVVKLLTLTQGPRDAG